MTDDGRRAAEVLARLQRAWSPSAGDAERVRRALGATLAGSTAGSTPTVAPRAAGWGGRLLAAGTIAAASGGIGYWAGHRAALRETSAVALVAPAVAPAGPSGPPAAPTAPEEALPVAAPAPLTNRHAGHAAIHETEIAVPTAETLAVEVRAIRNAERALRDGNPGLALAFLAELDRQVPGGKLTEERDAMSTLARCARGDHPFGVSLAEEFTERHPSSVYRARVEQACATTDSAGAGDSSGRRLPK